MAVRVLSKGLKRRQQTNLLSVAAISLSVVCGAILVSRRTEVKAVNVRDPVVVAQFDTVSIPVPAQSVPAGTKIKDIRFKNVTFPRHQVPLGALTDVTPMLELVSVATLPANLPIFRENLSSTYNSRNPVIERIPQGMRAMTIKVDATSAVEGWAGSGALVDVLLVTKDRTSVVAEKVKVLSAERSVNPVDGASAPSVPSTVTLLVSQEQCLAINTAIPLGKIAFALRSSTDEDNWSDPLYTPDRLKGGSVQRNQSAPIKGVVTVKGRSESFALSDGRWVRTEVLPSGFLVGKE